MEFDYETMCQVVHIQLNDIVRFCERFLNGESINPEEQNKIQRMFKIVNEKNGQED